MNIVNLIIQLQKKMSTATDPLDLLALNKAVNKLKAGSVEVVTYYSNLPDPIVNVGKLFYVMTDERLYWSYLNPSNVYTWEPIIMTSNSYIWSWGGNTIGPLGDGTTVNKSSPVSIIGGFSDWCDINVGSCSSIGIRRNGTIWTWGRADLGQLGNNTTTNKSSPVSIVGSNSNWRQISGGQDFFSALNCNGIIWSWGPNDVGQLGDGTAVAKSSPVSVTGGFADWCKISSGGFHTVGLRSDGTLWSWGHNSYGQLGDGTSITKSSPVSVVGGFTDWCQIDSGFRVSVGIRPNGTAWSWGHGYCGVLGDGTTVNKSSPVSVVGGFTDWCQASAGWTQTMALKTNGTAWSWGRGDLGMLGNNAITNRSSPVSVVGGFTDWCQISSSQLSNIAIRTNGTMWSWGFNNSGQLGDGTTINKSSPILVAGGFTNWCKTGNSTWCTMSGIRSTSF